MFLIKNIIIQIGQNNVGDLYKNTKTFKQGKSMKVTVFFHFDALSLEFSKTKLCKKR